MKRVPLYLFLTLISWAVIGWLMSLGSAPAQVQEVAQEQQQAVQYIETRYFEKGAQLLFEAPEFTDEVIAYDVRFSNVAMERSDFERLWDSLADTSAEVTMADVNYREGHLEKLLFHPSTPGHYHVALRGMHANGATTSVLFVEDVYIPQMEYHSVASTLPRKGLLPALELITLEQTDEGSFLTFAAPYSSIVDYEIRYVKEQLSENDLAKAWENASCADGSCVYFTDVKKQEGHLERILIKDLPEEGEIFTYGISYTLRTGETSAVSAPVYLTGAAKKEFGETYLEFVDGGKLFEAVTDIGAIYAGGTVRLSWTAPREAVEYYVVRFYPGQMTQDELDDNWDILNCFEGRNCLFEPKGDNSMVTVPLTQLPNPGDVYTYGVRYKVVGEKGLSKLSSPVYVEEKKVPTLDALIAAPEAVTPTTMMKEDPSLPAIAKLTVEDGDDSFYLSFVAPEHAVYSYQIHYLEGAVSRKVLAEGRYPVACHFVQHATIRSADSCASYYTIIKDATADDPTVRLQLRKADFSGVHTFFVSYYDDEYRKASGSNVVVVDNDYEQPALTDEVRKEVADLQLFPEEEKVVYTALAEGLLDPLLTEFYPHLEVNRAMLARYLLLSRSGRLDMFRLDYWEVFCDVSREEWYAPYTFALYALGVVDGYNDGACATQKNFVPQNKVRRAEALKIIFSFYHILPTADSSVTLPEDVSDDAWYATVMSYAVRKGIIIPDGYNKVYPEETISYLEALEYILATRSYVQEAVN